MPNRITAGIPSDAISSISREMIKRHLIVARHRIDRDPLILSVSYEQWQDEVARIEFGLTHKITQSRIGSQTSQTERRKASGGRVHHCSHFLNCSAKSFVIRFHESSSACLSYFMPGRLRASAPGTVKL